MIRSVMKKRTKVPPMPEAEVLRAKERSLLWTCSECAEQRLHMAKQAWLYHGNCKLTRAWECNTLHSPYYSLAC